MEPPDRAIDALWGTMRPGSKSDSIRLAMDWLIDDLPSDVQHFCEFMIYK